jgi:hypothetical protein
MKDIINLKNDIHNVIIKLNENSKSKKCCYICFNTIRRYSLERHFTMSATHNENLNIFIKDNIDMENEQIIEKFNRIVDFYINDFIQWR